MSSDRFIIGLLDAVIAEWEVGDVKFLADVKDEVIAEAARRAGGNADDIELLDSDEAAIIRYLDKHPDVQRATFGNPALPSWKLR